ncbi:MAG: radical SAM protein, partial [Acidimicrobiales bacterium]|nr:radical SAM protein [Acidimicrobiales bacterium]
MPSSSCPTGTEHVPGIRSTRSSCASRRRSASPRCRDPCDRGPGGGGRVAERHRGRVAEAGGPQGDGGAGAPYPVGVDDRTLTDGYGRVHRDLRISVTDRCNFRCTYCMPADGMAWLPRAELLTFEELARVARVCVERFGFDSIRLTGGEPTVRARLPVLIEGLAALGVDLALTTNGSLL